MPNRLLHIKNTVREKRLTNKEKRNRWISVESELQDVEQNRTIYFLFGGGDLKLNYVCILDGSSYRMLVAEGEIVHAKNPKVNYRLMIDNIASDLKSGKIRSHKRYSAKEFYEKYLKEFSSKESLQKLEASTIESTTTELPDLKQVIEEIKRSNASNRITIQNIENVKNTTNVLGVAIFHGMRRLNLLEISRSDKKNMEVVEAGILAAAVAMVAAIAAAVTFRSWSRKSKGRIKPEEETPSSSLINTITLESRDNCID